jgi:transposase InsO family protein
VAADFFVVPTATCRLLFVLVILAHDRRRVMHMAVTADPTAAWTAQQIPGSLPVGPRATVSFRDRDHACHAVTATVKAMGIEEVLTAPRSPWQNAYAERFIGSVRRECLDHVIVLSTAGLRKMLTSYVAYYENSRRTYRWRTTRLFRAGSWVQPMGASWRSLRSAAWIIDTNAAPPDESQRHAILIPDAITSLRGQELARLSRLVPVEFRPLAARSAHRRLSTHACR